jgi:hypothetical protein
MAHQFRVSSINNQPPRRFLLVVYASHDEVSGMVIPFGFNQPSVKRSQLRIDALQRFGQGETSHSFVLRSTRNRSSDRSLALCSRDALRSSTR